MQIDFLGTPLGGHFNHRINMIFVTVNTAGREQAQNMHGFAGRLRLINRVAISRIGEKVTIGDRFVNAGKVLIDHTAGTQCHMTHFGIAHLTLGQPHRHTGGVNQCFWIVIPQRLPDRSVGIFNRVVFFIIAISKAIKDKQYQWFFLFGHGCRLKLESIGRF